MASRIRLRASGILIILLKLEYRKVQIYEAEFSMCIIKFAMKIIDQQSFNKITFYLFVINWLCFVLRVSQGNKMLQGWFETNFSLNN